eukprot:CAMPEP_0172755470 /NCGR_PEP_ID=MMETSP1074-20121228/159903_1 /TAXON_ID=2916 /ORGANISM="Ceratium fusus, Strain PA161109" /LENGTH=105 /DNA_ID=CAMNT_0013588559 /DNA_START=660 /DNA_END=977 /DNA_ORIENTATION=+
MEDCHSVRVIKFKEQQWDLGIESADSVGIYKESHTAVYHLREEAPVHRQTNLGCRGFNEFAHAAAFVNLDPVLMDSDPLIGGARNHDHCEGQLSASPWVHAWQLH